MQRTASKDAAPSDASSEVSKAMQNLRRRLASDERPAGLPSAVVVLLIGDEAWTVDLRDAQLPAEQSVRRGEADAPDVTCKISTADFAAMLEGRLGALKAYTSKRLVVNGELKLLRSLSWLWEQPADAAPQEQGAVRVRVVEAKAAGDHGEYKLQVLEGAACWSVWRRWRELKEVTTALGA